MNSDQRLDKLSDAIAALTNKFSEFLAVESARQERDKHQVDINQRVLKHMEKVDADYKPTIDRSKKYHKWVDDFIGKKVIPLCVGLVVLSMISAAGYSLL